MDDVDRIPKFADIVSISESLLFSTNDKITVPVLLSDVQFIGDIYLTLQRQSNHL